MQGQFFGCFALKGKTAEVSFISSAMEDLLSIVSVVESDKNSRDLISNFVHQYDEQSPVLAQHVVLAQLVKVVSFFRERNSKTAQTYVFACFLLASLKKHFDCETINVVFAKMGYDNTR